MGGGRGGGRGGFRGGFGGRGGYAMNPMGGGGWDIKKLKTFAWIFTVHDCADVLFQSPFDCFSFVPTSIFCRNSFVKFSSICLNFYLAYLFRFGGGVEKRVIGRLTFSYVMARCGRVRVE